MMHSKQFAQMTAVSIALILIASNASGAESSSSNDWRPLFNGKNLRGWHVVLADEDKGIAPEKTFQVHDGLIHVYQDVPHGAEVPFGYLATDGNYSWYHLKLEYRWGAKRFASRTERPRDAGILYHASAEKRVWPRSVECQVQEGDTGDCFTVHGTQVQTTVDPVKLKSGVRHYLSAKDGGVDDVLGGPSIARIVKSATRERDDWNTVEVIVRGAEEVIYRVNGYEVFRAKNLKQLNTDEKTWIPLSSGLVLLQAEFAEVQYRNINIKPIEGGPLQVSESAPPPK
jgi:hypothetical protein